MPAEKLKPGAGRRTTDRQIEKNRRTQQQILAAAERVVGREGYAGASIARIAEKADVSIGMVYLHFKSREDLFDQLLPWCNMLLSIYVSKRVQGYSSYMDFEERNIRAFLAYTNSHPAFVRVMIEAAVAAPGAWESYLSARRGVYLQVMQEAFARGELPDYTADELPQLSVMVMDLRRAMAVDFLRNRKTRQDSSEAAVSTYLKFISRALHPAEIASRHVAPERAGGSAEGLKADDPAPVREGGDKPPHRPSPRRGVTRARHSELEKVALTSASEGNG